MDIVYSFKRGLAPQQEDPDDGSWGGTDSDDGEILSREGSED